MGDVIVHVEILTLSKRAALAEPTKQLEPPVRKDHKFVWEDALGLSAEAKLPSKKPRLEPVMPKFSV